MTINGHHIDPMALGVMLGSLNTETQRQTEIALSHMDETRRLREDLHDLPDRIAARLPQTSAPPAVHWGTALNFMKAMAAGAVLAAVVAGKMTWSEAFPWLRSLLGLS